MSPDTSTLTPAQARFVAEHHGTVGLPSRVNPLLVFVYGHGPGGSWRWLVDSWGSPLQTTHFH